MNVLGVESSCDETAAAVVQDGRKIISNVVNSQIDIHKIYGGVVPEVAARSHLEVVVPVIEQAVSQTGGWSKIDAVACTMMPGLIGSLLMGSITARTLALVHHKPFYACHHVEGHVYANFLMDNPPEFPFLALIVSGGHSQIVLFKDHGDYLLLGQTADDAVGEAFDKVAKIIGLPYPGGPAISKAAENGDPHRYHLPKAKMKGKYDFSFSGVKTALLRTVQDVVGVDHTFPSYQLAAKLSQQQVCDLAASFQYTAVDTLVEKLVLATNEYQPKSVVIAGGVAANQELRRQLRERLPIDISFPTPALCTDNGAMIAALGYYKAQRLQPDDPRNLDVIPSISMTKTIWGLH